MSMARCSQYDAALLVVVLEVLERYLGLSLKAPSTWRL